MKNPHHKSHLLIFSFLVLLTACVPQAQPPTPSLTPTAAMTISDMATLPIQNPKIPLPTRTTSPFPPFPLEGKITFWSYSGGTSAIYLLDLVSYETHKISGTEIKDHHPYPFSWSPNGEYLTYVALIGDYRRAEIYLVNLNNDKIWNLSFNPTWDSDPAWSGDGSAVAFDSNREGYFGIYVWTLADGEIHNITQHPSNGGSPVWSPIWSPDGGKIAFISHRDEINDIYLMDPDGMNQTRLTYSDIPYINSHSWSPDGNKIAFMNQTTLFTYDIFIIDVDGNNLFNLTDTANLTGDIREYSWSPDGSKIAFSIEMRSGNDIFIADVRTKEITQLTFDGKGLYPTWSPDGSMIAFVRIGRYKGDSTRLITVMEISGEKESYLIYALDASIIQLNWIP